MVVSRAVWWVACSVALPAVSWVVCSVVLMAASWADPRVAGSADLRADLWADLWAVPWAARMVALSEAPLDGLEAVLWG